jgi:hypothetical protein
MEKQISWREYNDEWNSDIFKLDCDNKLKFVEKLLNTQDKKEDVDINVIIPTNNNSNSNSNKNITFDDVLNIIKTVKLSNETYDLTILENVIRVINYCINNHNVRENTYKDYLIGINWICDVIKYFIKELNIPLINSKSTNILSRSSYRLCPQKSNCIFQYPDNNSNPNNNNNNCKYQHLPYSNLLLDCNSIKYYLDSHFSNSNNNDLNVGELKRCLTTINFVIMIIYRELDTIDKYRKYEPNYNIRKYHCYHPIFKFDDKKKQHKEKYYN